jgi:phage terminase large subunit
MLKLNRKWFNPLYFILNELIKDNSIRTILVYGGKSSSKTISICQLLSKECYVKGANSIAFRKESAIIPTTLKKSFNLSQDSMYLNPAFERQDRRFLCTNQGGETSEIVMKGLDDPEKAKGIESYKYVYLDELNHFEQAEYEQFNLSLRGIEGQKIFASWNPVDENSWVKTELVDKYEFVETEHKLPSPDSFVKRSTCGKVVLIRTMYLDNYWIVGSPKVKLFNNDGSEIVDVTDPRYKEVHYGYRDENLISEYEGLRTKNNNSYKVNVLGEWGKVVFGGEFLKCWRSEQHTGEYPYDPTQAIYLYFDENVNPYFPCGFFQVGRDLKSPRMVHYIAAKNPNNKISWVGREIVRKLTEWGHKEKVFIGGDATSQKDDIKLEDGDDMFRLIMKEIKEFKPERRTGKRNPSVRMSADFFNSILEGNITGLSFGVDKKCRVPILDYENTKEDKNGKVDKSTVTDPITKVSYQPYGHFVDLTRYFLVDTFRDEYVKYERGGKTLNVTLGKNVSKNSY